jgi:hypothetical protein
MKTRLTALLFAATFSAALAHAATVLPDACGSDKAKFDVETAKPATAAVIQPVAGKARVVFIETVINTGYPFGGPSFTTRFGVDGKWVGAASNNSYFVLDFDPGVHHLCSAIQTSFSAPKDKIGIASFTAEAGKVYYLDYMITNKSSGGGVHFVQGSNSPLAPAGTPPPPPTMVSNPAQLDSSNGLGFLGEDEAKFRIKSSKVSTSTPQASDSAKP